MPEQRSGEPMAAQMAAAHLRLALADAEAEIQRLRSAGRALRQIARYPVESSIQAIDAAIKQWDEETCS